MKKVTLTIRTVSPTLMGGSFGQNDGIRPSEIKGLMRYWFRAVADSVIEDIKALKSLEEKVFGSQNRKSPFSIVIEDFNSNSLEKIEFNKLPNGVKYLGFVINMNKERLENVVKAGSEFKVKLLFRKFTDEKIVKLVAYSFYFATALGGFGLRARRGFGSWQIIDVETKGINKNLDNLTDYDLGKNETEDIKKVIENSRKLIKELANIENLNRNLGFKTIDENCIYVYKLNGDSWEKALDNLGNSYKIFRKNNKPTTPEYFNIRNYISKDCKWNKIKQNQWNFAFGLPIQINSREGILNILDIPPKRNKKGNITPTTIGRFKVKHKNEYLERLPSTVWFSIKEYENEYYVILTYLEGKLFPDEESDKIIFEFDKYLNLTRKCESPPKSVEIEYDVNDLKEKAKSFVKEGLKNVRRK